jgi:hypothetical protein
MNAMWEESMNPKRPKTGDEENTSFELALEDLKPGVADSEEKPGDTTKGNRDHDRFPRRDKKDIPQESLANRIRGAAKGG